MISQQLAQILSFLEVYDVAVVQAAVVVYFSGSQASVFAGRSSEVPLAQSFGELTEDAKAFVMEESRDQPRLLPFCSCGTQFALVAVCPSCEKGLAGYRSKYTCGYCSSEAYFTLTVQEQLERLRLINNDAAASPGAPGGY